MSTQHWRYNDKRKELILTHCDFATLPMTLLDTYGQCTEYLDCSHNHLTQLSFIYKFEKLKYLILDCNRLHEAHLRQWKRPMPQVKLLMLNRNELMDLSSTIEILSEIFPNLEYLSLHGNPICPDGLELQPFSEYVNYEYEYYRSSILRAFRQLKFLDHFDLQRSYKTNCTSNIDSSCYFKTNDFYRKLKNILSANIQKRHQRKEPANSRSLRQFRRSCEYNGARAIIEI